MATFTKTGLTITDAHGIPILLGTRNPTSPRLWKIDITPQPSPHVLLTAHDQPRPSPMPSTMPPMHTAHRATPHVRAYDLPNTPALIAYLHAAAGYPVRSTWLNAIKRGHYRSWPGLTYTLASHYCPDADETHQGHMAQPQQHIRSTQPQPPHLPQPHLPVNPMALTRLQHHHL